MAKKLKETKENKIEVVAGNIPVLTIQLLNSINQNLVNILEELKRG